MNKQEVKQEKRLLQTADVTGMNSREILHNLTEARGIHSLHVWLEHIGAKTYLCGYMFQSECPVPFMPTVTEQKAAVRKAAQPKGRAGKKSKEDVFDKQATVQGLFEEETE